MKTFIKRDHAELLMRQYMGMRLGHDIMLKLYNREAYSHQAFSRHADAQDRHDEHAASRDEMSVRDSVCV